jgi:serine/threonine-protein kinase
MSPTTPGIPTGDWNLLFGMLAVHEGFLSRETLRSAERARTSTPERSLGELLVEQRLLTPEQRETIDKEIAEHLLACNGQAVPDPTEQLQTPTLQADLSGADCPSSDHPSTLFVIDEQGEPAPTAVPQSQGVRYEALRPHARGGLGVVLVARDSELGREVALKEMEAGSAGNLASRARFVREAQITGGLEHPGIVPVYGLGHYADGRPFYAMRFIRGETLQDAINKLHAGAAGYTLRGLLMRFVTICNAVAFAHSRGVIHRDLKPSNVMLGRFGETLVVDWGLAKIIGRDPSNEVLASESGVILQVALGDESATQAGLALGTPAYMSPEQATGEVEKLSPATDIYSLGAVLYVILTGQAPVTGGNVLAVLAKVQRGDWPRPRQLKPEAPPALNAICCKAMALRPDTRYRSALDLAADVEHWLADDPVTAYAEPWAARLRRWRRRHRAAVAASAAVAVMLVVLGVAALVSQLRDQARRRAGAEATLKQVVHLQESGHWSQAMAELQRAEERLGNYRPEDLQQRLDFARRELKLITELDDLRLKRATSTGSAGDFDEAATDQGYTAAFATAGLGSPEDTPEAVAERVQLSASREALVAALDNWASVTKGERRAWALQTARLADPNPWRDRLRDPRAWEDGKTLARVARATPAKEATPALAAAVGGQLRWKGEGENLLRAAQALRPGDFWLNFYLGYLLNITGRAVEGEAFCRASLAARPDSSMAWNNLGLALDRQGKLAPAADAYNTAIDLNPKNVYPHANLAVLSARLQKLDDAEAHFRKVIELAPPNSWARNNLARLLEHEGQMEKAIALYRETIDLDPGSSMAYSGLGALLDRQSKPREALPLYRKAVELDPNNVDAFISLAQAEIGNQKYSEASEAARRALALLPPGDLRRPLAEVVLRQVKLAERLPGTLRGENSGVTAEERLALSDMCYHQRRFATAARLAADAFAADSKVAGNLQMAYRYNAACCAALAGTGNGEDDAVSDDKSRADLRRQALTWLKADVAERSRLVPNASPVEAATTLGFLRNTLSDPDLASVRDPRGLAKLPAAERTEWQAFWAEIQARLAKAPAGK